MYKNVIVPIDLDKADKEIYANVGDGV